MPATDETLDQIGGLTGLLKLNLYNNEVTDTGLAHLKGLTKPAGTPRSPRARVTDAGLVHVRSLTSLQTLRLDQTQVSDFRARALERADQTGRNCFSSIRTLPVPG